MEPPFENLSGVISVVSGYTGGTKDNPTYAEVSSGDSGHAEAILVTYDPEKVTYETLLDTFWRSIDPTTVDQQFSDRGSQYRTAIFYHDSTQKKAAEQSKKALEKSGQYAKQIVTKIVPAGSFYPAEAYHQDYYKKNPTRYKLYRHFSGRDRYLKKIWGSSKK